MRVTNQPRTINLGDLRAIAARSRRRGVGDAGTCVDPSSGLPIDCTTGLLMPGFSAATAAQQAAFEAGAPVGTAFSAMTAAQQAAYLAAGADPSLVSSTTTANVGPMCFTPLFPWVGNQITGGGSPSVCSPVFNVPSPWNGLITVAAVGLLAFKLLGGRR